MRSLVAIALMLVAPAAHAQIGGTPRAIVHAYNDTARAVADRMGGEADPSRGAYQDAWESMPRSKVGDEALATAVRVVAGDDEDTASVRAKACRTLFAEAPAASVGIPGPACAALKGAGRAFAAMLRGARAGTGSSAMDLWDPWHTAQIKQDPTVGLGFIVLARAAVLQGYVWAHTGRLGEAFSLWMATARMAHDLGRGPLVQHMIGVAIQGMAWRAIAAQLRRARPSAQHLEWLRDGAAELGRPAWRHDQVMQAEYVVMFADMLAGMQTKGAHYPPAHEFLAMPIGGLEDRVLFSLAMPEMQQYWEQLVRVAGAPWPQRLRRYGDLEVEARQIRNPLAQVAAISFTRYDRRARYQHCRWKLLEVLAADALGAPVDRTDPLTGRPVREARSGDLKHFKSSAIGHPDEALLTATDREIELAIATPGS